MAGVMPTTASEAYMKLLQQIAVAMAAPDANIDELTKLQTQVLASVRKPFDTASAGSPVGSAMDLSAGASAPEGPAPGAMSPMLAALMGGGGGPAPAAPPAAGSYPIPGVRAGNPAPNMDEVRRMLTSAGNRNM